MDLVHSHLNKYILYLCLTAVPIAVCASSPAVSFDEFVRNPGAYQGRRISVVGIAEVDGISFTLFQPPHREVSRSIFVGQKLGRPRYNQLNDHWVKVTGIAAVDEQKTFAAKIFLDRVDALRRPPIRGVKIFGIFFNEGPTSIHIELVNEAGNESTKLVLRPDGIEKTIVATGAARVVNPAGRVLSECPIESEYSEFFELSDRTFYFRIKDGRISLVQPRNATTIKKRWGEIEKAQ